MAIHISHSPEETQMLGEAWGRAATSGLVIGLSGDLGAGKTQLAKGIARGLGFMGRVHSPTFTLINQYEGGRLMLFHLDLYRLETAEQILAAGLEEYFHPAGVAVVEWAERCGANSRLKSMFGVPPLGGSGESPKGGTPNRLYREVRIEVVNETERRIIYEDFGG